MFYIYEVSNRGVRVLCVVIELNIASGLSVLQQKLNNFSVYGSILNGEQEIESIV